jgi:hypothetical protein
MIEGWECPKCGQVFAPFVKKCDTCIGNTTKITINPPIQIPECQHIWGGMATSGVYCTLCGTQQMSPLPSSTVCSVEDPETGNLRMHAHDWIADTKGGHCAVCPARTESDIFHTNDHCLSCGAPHWGDHTSTCKAGEINGND